MLTSTQQCDDIGMVTDGGHGAELLHKILPVTRWGVTYNRTNNTLMGKCYAFMETC